MALPRPVVALSLALIAAAVWVLAARLPGAGGERRQPAPAPPPSASQDAAQPEEPRGPPLLLPNLRSLRAEDLFVQETPVGRELRFAAWLANLGPGPLMLRPRPPSSGCPRGQHSAVQLVHRDKGVDGIYRLGKDPPLRRRFAGCMLMHADHDHWHFDAMASYVLRDPATDEVLAARRKVSFCLRDNRRVRGVPTLVRREYFGECSRTTGQGISPGWIDVYSSDLPGQSLPLPFGREPRVLCLDLTADPRELTKEGNENDNGTSIGLRVADLDVRLAPGARC